LEVVADRDVWRLNLELLLPQPSRTWAGSEKKEEDYQKLIIIIKIHPYW